MCSNIRWFQSLTCVWQHRKSATSNAAKTCNSSKARLFNPTLVGLETVEGDDEETVETSCGELAAVLREDGGVGVEATLGVTKKFGSDSITLRAVDGHHIKKKTVHMMIKRTTPTYIATQSVCSPSLAPLPSPWRVHLSAVLRLRYCESPWRGKKWKLNASHIASQQLGQKAKHRK